MNENYYFLKNIISSKNYNVYLVGGAVRDLISKGEIHDYDLASDIPFDELAKIYNINYFKENDNRNTISLLIDDSVIEITALKGKTIEEDLSKRDFTINAIAIDSDFNIIDPYKGVSDINNKVIRVVDETGEGFVKDPLRILRAVRFSATKGYEIDDNTKELMNKQKDKLDSVASERILNELSQLLSVDEPGKIIFENKEIIFKIIPELKETLDFNQYNDYHIYDVFRHILKVVDTTPNDLNLRYAALFHDIGKPRSFFKDENGIGHFYGHSEISRDIFDKFADKYKVPKYNKAIIDKLILFHDRKISTKNISIKRFLHSFGADEYEINLLFLLKRADILSQNPEYNNRLEALDYLENKCINIINADPVLRIADLDINGRDLLELGFVGEEIGLMLNLLLEKVINEELANNREELLRFIEENKIEQNKRTK